MPRREVHLTTEEENAKQVRTREKAAKATQGMKLAPATINGYAGSIRQMKTWMETSYPDGLEEVEAETQIILPIPAMVIKSNSNVHLFILET
jgi:hypothetical protein